MTTEQENVCPICEGEGKTYSAMDMLARDPKDQEEYETGVRAMGKHTCAMCNGTGTYVRDARKVF